MAFNPQDHLLQLPKRIKDPKTQEWVTIQENYLEVKWRLCWFRDRYPHGTIVTEEVYVDLDREISVSTTNYGKTTTKTGTGYARYKTTVTDGEGGVATGYGTENAAEFADFCERAETRSIGRALAGLGIGTQFIGQEMTEMDHVVDGPVSRKGDDGPVVVSAPEATAGYEHTDMHEPPRGSGGPFVGSAPQAGASMGVQAPAPTSASRSAGPEGAGRTSGSTAMSGGHSAPEKPTLLNTEQLRAAINQEFKRLADSYSVTALCQRGWGTAIDSLDKVRGLKDGSLRTGLKRLQALHTEQPPADPPPAGEGATPSPVASSSVSGEEDVPNHPPPGGYPQEGPQVAPGSTQSPGLTQGAGAASIVKGEVELRQCLTYSKTGIRCVREPHTTGEHYFILSTPTVNLPAAAQLIVVPDPETGVRYVSNSDAMLLRQWCNQQAEMSFFASAVADNPRTIHGNVMITEGQYWKLRAAVEALVSMNAADEVSV